MKAQLFSLEGILSLTAFMIMLIFLLSFWNVLSARMIDAATYQELQLQAAHVTDLLLSSPGFPPSWENNSATVVTPGLMDYSHVLDPQKITQFAALNYTTVKRAFNIERFEFRFELRDATGSVLNSLGQYPDEDDDAVVFKRLMLVNNQTREVLVTLW